MRLVYKDCRFCKGTGEIFGKKCKVCRGEGQIPVKVPDAESEKNEEFTKAVDKIKSKYGNVSETELKMLREMFDFGVEYGKRK